MALPVKKVFYAGYIFHIWQGVYEPAEDSFLFAENLTVQQDEDVLDMGTGCGILGIIAAKKSFAGSCRRHKPQRCAMCREKRKAQQGCRQNVFRKRRPVYPVKTREKI